MNGGSGVEARGRSVRDTCILLAGLIAGISGYGAGYGLAAAICAVILIVIMTVVYIGGKKNAVRAWRVRGLPPVIAGAGFVVLGIFTAFLNERDTALPQPVENIVGVEGRVIEKRVLSTGERLTLKVEELFLSNGSDITRKRMRNLDIEVRAGTTEANVDDRIVVGGKVRSIRANRNMPDTSYIDNYHRRGIFYFVRADEEAITVTGHVSTMAGYSHRLRDRLTTFIEKSGLNSGTSHFLITILLGNREYLHNEPRQSFAVAGVSHTLALSGMHISIIAGLLLVLFFPLTLVGRYKWQLLLATIMLWGYVFVSGMNPSTIRGAIMFSIMTGGVIVERRNEPLRGLALSLILILIVNPSALYNVGLQMSALCVAMLIFFAARFNPVSQRRHPYLYRVATLLSASICVSVSLWVVNAFYFKSVTPAFLWANLVMLPLLPVYLYLAIVYLIGVACGLKIGLIGDILNFGFEKLEVIINFIGNENAVYCDVSAATLYIWVTGVILIGVYLEYHRRKRLLWTGGALMIASLVVMSLTPVQAPLLIVHDGYEGMSLSLHHKGKTDSFTLPRGSVTETQLRGQTIVAVDMPCDAKEDHPFDERAESCDILIIGGGHKGDLKRLVDHYNPKKVVVHKSVRRKHEGELYQEAKALGRRLHSLRNDGPLRLRISDAGLSED